MKKNNPPPETSRIREIPYNYTSYTDKEIVSHLLGQKSWELLNDLRKERRTGRSARMLFEALGDMWVVYRNPYLQDDLLQNPKRWRSLTKALHHRLDQIKQRLSENESAIGLNNNVRSAVHDFEAWFPHQKEMRQKVFKALKKVTRKDNIHFDGLARVAHASDASDWRIELPFVVITPDSEEEMLPIIQTCIQLELTIIPRGGGTGYTGSAVPLYPDTAIINTEKLISTRPIEEHAEGTGKNKKEYATIEVGSGVVTKRVSDLAEAAGYVFAVDPTSQTASTIGGNIAMNAGGKKAVLWGTSLDNLLSWKMINPDGKWIVVERLNPNFGKIHEQKTAEFKISRLQKDGKTLAAEPEILKISGKKFRKEGLGKDVTDKFLEGLPGIQKEGCDGMITSAVFILHKQPKHVNTFCLEFFGHDLKKSVPTIVEIVDFLHTNKEVALAGLEHLDEKYIEAIKYNTKAPTSEMPKMVLLGDLNSENEKALQKALQTVEKLAQKKKAYCFIAKTPESRRNFWHDRTRTAAIAAHTNAFKINEDVVIPLGRLYEYNEGIETINIRYSIKNKLDILEAVMTYLSKPIPELDTLQSYESSEERKKIISSKRKAALAHCEEVKTRWSFILNHLERPAKEAGKHLGAEEKKSIKSKDRLKDLFLRHDIRISYRQEVEKILKEIFAGSELDTLRKKIDCIHTEIRPGRLFVATHMHAGDGNVHTNIPVNSHNYKMMQNAHDIVVQVMQLATSLNGVISGEHGIGITKYEFLNQENKKKFVQYKNKIDPLGRFNRGKLLPESENISAYTPSLQLLQQEAIILEQSELGEINDMTRHCLRCGKCKPVCTTHVPRANLLYAPRNKILGTGMLMEAFLYEEQTRRGISLQHFNEFNDICEHCTICHKCVKPCPVDIDFGDVSVKMKNVLINNRQKRFNLISEMTMQFLISKSPRVIHLFRSIVFRPAFIVQRIIYNIAKNKKFITGSKLPAATTGPVTLTSMLINSIRKPLPILPAENFRSVTRSEDRKYVTIIKNPKVKEEDAETVFFFPGCGVERLFSNVGLAGLAMLYDMGIQVVLPPEYTCCGAPQTASGKLELSKKMAAENRVLFHRVSNTLNYLDIKTVLVSCGTCHDSLSLYEFEKIFPGARLIDIHEFILEKGRKLDGKNNTSYIFHDPCHTPMKTGNPQKITEELVGKPVVLSDRCCAESGLFAVSRPDIATQARFSKLESMQSNLVTLTGKKKAAAGNVKVLTTCPSCLQGLSRYVPETGAKPTYIVNEMALELLGKNWKENFKKNLRKDAIERVLL